MRKSILACTVSVLMSPVASWALGMGDIQVNSKLNQALNAEIELHSVSKKDLDSLHVGLAPKSAYSRADIDYSNYLSEFRFEIIKRGGKNYVTITTRKPFKEPFASFLMEAKWGAGRLLREYTMLVDPPEFVKMNARPVTTASTSRSTQVKRATPAPKATPKPTPKPKATPKTETAPKTTAKTVEKPEAKKPVEPDYVLSPTATTGELVYGPTKNNDTLWAIADQMAPAHVSVDQMMMALLRDNPDAFVDNNINNLKSGYVLRIKDPSTLTQLDHLAARRQVREQYQTWKETRQQQVSSANVVDRSDRSADDKAKKDGELKLVASGSKDSTSTSGQGTLSDEAAKLKEELAMAGEELESQEIKNQELQERIKELEAIIETKTSLVELKDASLAALQKQKQLSQQEESTEISEIVTTSETTEEMVMEDIASSDESNVTGHIDSSVELTKDSVSIDSPDAEEITSSVTETIIESEPEPKPEKKTEPAPKPKPVTKPKPVPEESLIDSLLSEENLPYVAGGGGLLVLILAWLGLRGRGKKENEFEESILDSKLSVEESEFTVDDSEIIETEEPSTEVMTSDTETSFLSDFSSDDMESLKPDDTEADPISEADVFMVYGRYQQAEELLKTAITQEPERLDYQMKLLEVYHGDNQKEAFGVQADVVRDALKQNNDNFEQTSEWTKAKSWAEKLGLDIEMPDSFDEELSVTETSSEVESSDELALDDISEDLSLDAEDITFDDDSKEADFDLSLDESDNLDLDIDDSLSLDSMEEEQDEGFELSLEDFDTEETTDVEDTLDLSNEVQEDLSEDTLNFETDSFELELEDTPETADTDSFELDIDSEDLSIKDDVSGLSIEEQVEDLSIEEQVEDSLATVQDDELDLLDDDMDFDDLDDDFAELDAVGTKLDLAKAYIDMGDMESASSILNEVIDEGNDDQKTQAQALLNQTS